MSYVFHCTPCGFAHAGECAPKYIPVSPAAPPGAPGSTRLFIPHVGTKWNIEDYNHASCVWVRRTSYDLHYTVIAVDTNRMVALVSTHSFGMTSWDQEIASDAFLPTGHTGYSATFRMVHRP